MQNAAVVFRRAFAWYAWFVLAFALKGPHCPGVFAVSLTGG